MFTCFVVLALVAQILAAPVPATAHSRKIVRPQVKSTTYIANVTDPSLSRDSCGSVRIGDRVLWTCRDTTFYNAQQQKCTLPMVSNTASWTDLTTSGSPAVEPTGLVGAASCGAKPILQMYGSNTALDGSFAEHFALQQDQCPEHGVCDDGTRWVVWPDSPPLVTQSSASNGIGYTWTPNVHLRALTTLNSQTPSHALYKTVYTQSSDRNALPSSQLVDGNFWKEGDIGFGRYGNVITIDGIAYLYGQTSSKVTALAKVAASHIEDQNHYQYYDNGAWTSQKPSMSSTTAAIPNAGAGGQGTFYFSSYLDAYVWIGQQANSVAADFYMTTAPKPEGPWLEPWKIFAGQNGDHALGAYSLQAHPSLGQKGDGSDGGVYVTWTQQWLNTTLPEGYVTPLVWIEFE